MTTGSSLAPPRPETASAVRPVAVIDIGTTAIRMAIAEIDAKGAIRQIDALSQAVNLGRDSFTRGHIEKTTVEECVRVLKSYRRLLEEYQIVSPEQIRVVATSAVREAANRLHFVDRIFIATGLVVETLDEAEVNRITYLGAQPYLKDQPETFGPRTLVVEVGGGTTEVLLVQHENVSYSHTFRLGSLRMQQQFHAFRGSADKLRSIMENQIDQIVDQVVRSIPPESGTQMMALGGDVRFAASQLLEGWVPDQMGQLSVAALERFTNRMLQLSIDEIAHKYHIPFPDAETLGPALLTYVKLAKAYKLDHLLVTNINLRDGLLKEMAIRDAWTDEFRDQILRSAADLGRKFHFDERHARHVSELCRTLFHALQADHQLGPRQELILQTAALLHEIGLYVGLSSHHKHSMYLILHSELFGLGHRDVRLVALVARYHRRASPKPTHPLYNNLDREGRVIVAKLAALLRVADALDHSHAGRIQEIRCHRESNQLVITVPRIQDLALEQLALKQKGPLFEETFGLKVLLRKGRG